MKVAYPLLFTLALLLPQLEAQFINSPDLPSPPRLLFGGFRPFFSTRSRRPPRRPPPFLLQRPNIQTQQGSFSSPPAQGGFRPPQQQQNFFRPQQSAFQSSPTVTTRAVNFRPQGQQQQQQQNQVVHLQPIELNGFGAPKPQSIINGAPQGPPVPQQQPRPAPPPQPRPPEAPQQVFDTNTVFLEDQFLHRPVNFLPDNNIVGMVPPPLQDLLQNRPSIPPRPIPPPQFTPRQPSQQQIQVFPPRQAPSQPSQVFPPRQPSAQQSQVHQAQPVFENLQIPAQPSQQITDDLQFQFIPLHNVPTRPEEITTSRQRPQQQFSPLSVDPSDLQFFNHVNSINSNSIEDLVINKVPPVNAGVLPLAHEKPSQLELFPPFNTRRGR